MIIYRGTLYRVTLQNAIVSIFEKEKLFVMLSGFLMNILLF
jgi:hypothetical protein